MKKRTDKCLRCPDQGGLPSLAGYAKNYGLCGYHQAINQGWTKDEAAKMYPDHPCVTYNNANP